MSLREDDLTERNRRTCNFSKIVPGKLRGKLYGCPTAEILKMSYKFDAESVERHSGLGETNLSQVMTEYLADFDVLRLTVQFANMTLKRGHSDRATKHARINVHAMLRK